MRALAAAVLLLAAAGAAGADTAASAEECAALGFRSGLECDACAKLGDSVGAGEGAAVGPRASRGATGPRCGASRPGGTGIYFALRSLTRLPPRAVIVDDCQRCCAKPKAAQFVAAKLQVCS